MVNTAESDSFTLVGEGALPIPLKDLSVVGLSSFRILATSSLLGEELPETVCTISSLVGKGSWNWSGESKEILLAASASRLALVVGWMVMEGGGSGRPEVGGEE